MILQQVQEEIILPTVGNLSLVIDSMRYRLENEPYSTKEDFQDALVSYIHNLEDLKFKLLEKELTLS